MQERTESKLTVLLPYELKKRFKAACTERDTEMSDVIRSFIEAWIKKGGSGTK